MAGKNISNKKIAIIGGGPGGLTLARLLQMNGAVVNVYERDVDQHARVQGATLNINDDSGLIALHKAGLMEEFKKHFRPEADKLAFTDLEGKVIYEELSDQEHVDGRPEIDRGPLRHMLLDSLKSDTVIWDHQFLSLEQQSNGGIKLTFKNGKTSFADIVIASDGANSKIRPYITSIKPVYSGVTIVEGTINNAETDIPEIFKLLNGGKVCAVGDEKSIFVIQKGDGSAAFYTAHHAEENWSANSGVDFSDNKQVLEWYGKDFDKWGALWHDLLSKSSVFTPRPQYYLPFDQSWDTLSNLTMIGDAAHVMPPYAGEGVNMAMFDALELSEALLDDNFTDVRSAIAAYESKMLERTSNTAKITMEYTKMFHAPDAIDNLVAMFTHH